MAFFPPAAPSYILKHLVEREAQRFRVHLGFGPTEPLNPFEVAELLGLEVVYPDDLPHFNQDTGTFLHGAGRRCWSGMTCFLRNQVVVIVLNPAHSLRRRRATIMEEVSHVDLQHKTTSVALDGVTGLMRRSYDSRQEQEAYWFGSAIFVPKYGLKQLYVCGGSPNDAADYYAVSQDLIHFRTRLHGLGKLIATPRVATAQRRAP